MKRYLLFLAVFAYLCAPSFASDDMFDFDMNYIDDPFAGRKAVTKEQFNQAINQKMQKRKGLIEKFRDYLNRNKPENDPALQNPKYLEPTEIGKSAKEVENTKPTLLIPAPIMDSFNKRVPNGYYQVTLSDTNGEKMINLHQGTKLYGSIKAKDTKDDWDENLIIYARTIYPSENVVKIIFSNLDDCVEGYARILN